MRDHADVRAAKQALRRVLSGLRRLTSEARATASGHIAEQVRLTQEWRAARVVALYAATRDEPDVDPLGEAAWADGKVVVLPRVVRGAGDPSLVCHRFDRGDALVRGAFGLLEPDPAWPVLGHDAVELWVVPGVGFDRAGGRLGRGGGYYDAALASSSAPSIGVCFAAQLVDVVPSEPHDRPVRRVVVG